MAAERTTVEASSEGNGAAVIRGYEYTAGYGYENNAELNGELKKHSGSSIEGKKTVYLFVKRAMDIVLSLLGLIVLSPLFLVVAIAIKLDSKGPVFFNQTRVGKDAQLFTMYKFRSMCEDAEARQKDLIELNERDGPVFKIRNDPRVTRVGEFIRKTCIDELPQLLNIVKGDMSIVGPRPLPQYEAEKCTEYQRQRLAVIPGLTCYWQVCVREKVNFDEWVEMDLEYIRERSFWVDMKLFFETFRVILKHEGSK